MTTLLHLSDFIAIETALAANQFETARRMCLAQLENSADDNRIRLLKLLHEAFRGLGDLSACRRTLEMIQPHDDETRIQVLVLLGQDYYTLATDGAYRQSAEAEAGLTIDEFRQKMSDMARTCMRQAEALATSTSTRHTLAEAMRPQKRSSSVAQAASASPGCHKPDQTDIPAAIGGVLRFPDGRLASDVEVVLGLVTKPTDNSLPDPCTLTTLDVGYVPNAESPNVLRTRTDSAGRFHIDGVSPGTHPFLAVCLDPHRFDIATRFLMHNVLVQPGSSTLCDLTITEWVSAPTKPIVSRFPSTILRAGTLYRRKTEWHFANPFLFDFPRQPVTLRLSRPFDAARHILVSSIDPLTPLTYQHLDDAILCMTDLPSQTTRDLALYQCDAKDVECDGKPIDFNPLPELTGTTAVIDTGRAAFRIPWGTGDDSQPPLLRVRGEDGWWRGHGRLLLPDGVCVLRRQSRVVETGPLRTSVEIHYDLSNHATYRVQLTAYRDEPCILVREICPIIESGSFEFSLREFAGGRGYLHWMSERGEVHWTDLGNENRQLAKLQESVPWWIYPAGFAYAMIADGLDQRDYIAVFTIERGCWVDRRFEQLAQGPGNHPGAREMDWPYPEMVGSTISMITAETRADGDAVFHFPFFDGERRWGLMISTLERNDGPWKELSAIQHKYSSPRLDDFKNWNLDRPDNHQRPSVVCDRSSLGVLRGKKATKAFSPIWEKIAGGNVKGPASGLTFALDGDPAVAWKLKQELVSAARIYSRMTLLGRDFSDIYSPVGARPISRWCEQYDLIAASGVFTPEEERLMRAFFMLMAHMYMETDLMNWRFNSRNANFEADRAEVVGIIGLAFPDNPDADSFICHAADALRRSIDVYCTPGSGKWYENPACYYLQASKCWMNLAFHLAHRGILDLTAFPRLKDFLRWGILLLTPPCPDSYPDMSGGTSAQEYHLRRLVRRIAPIGDHAHLGPWVPEHYAFMAKLYRPIDPSFADQLLWAYQAGGSDGGYFGNLPLLFATLHDEHDLQPASMPLLTSSRLEGFGAVLRDHFNQPQEFYLLLKQGPGGYRYHRTEGGIILFANGKPLIYEGGEGGETWRHTTLSFYDSHMPLAPGRVERFHDLPGVSFIQGVHPAIIHPGEPVFLSDVCDPAMIPLSHQRHVEPHPANSRTVISIRDEYVVLHDELFLPDSVTSHWHLHAVADEHLGNSKDGFIFRGRFGTDLQVLLPNQKFTTEKIEQLPFLEYHMTQSPQFSTRHLMLTAQNADHYLAILRPMFAEKQLLTAHAIRNGGRTIGVQVCAIGLNDHLFFNSSDQVYDHDHIHFEGRYGAVLHRNNRTELFLSGTGCVKSSGLEVVSEGLSLHIHWHNGQGKLTAEGQGGLWVKVKSRLIHLQLDGRRISSVFR